jgi:ACS family 4-hydroxyphenylacetate permease-like MFS transporter
VFIVLAVLTIWTPQIVRAVLPQAQFWLIGVISAVPPLAATIGLPLWAARSDARRERKWHVILPMLLAGCGLAIAAYAPIPPLKLLGLVICSAGMYGSYGVFWALVSVILPEAQRPAGIALIHVGGTLGAILSPLAVGYLRDLTGNFSASLLFAVAVAIISAALIGLVSPPRSRLSY